MEEPRVERTGRPRRPSSEERLRRRRRTMMLWLARLVIVAVVFLIGLVVGRAIEDAPKPGGTQTGVKTLEPSTLKSVETVTVTVTSPP